MSNDSKYFTSIDPFDVALSFVTCCTTNVSTGALPEDHGEGEAGDGLRHATPHLRLHNVRLCGVYIQQAEGAEGAGQLPGGGPEPPAGPMVRRPLQTQRVSARTHPEANQ